MTKVNSVSNIDNNQKLVKTASFIGSAVGIASAVGGIYKSAQKGNPNLKFKNLTYAEKDILKIGAGSIAGGLIGGLITDKNKKIEILKSKKRFNNFSETFFVLSGYLQGPKKYLKNQNLKCLKLKLHLNF